MSLFKNGCQGFQLLHVFGQVKLGFHFAICLVANADYCNLKASLPEEMACKKLMEKGIFLTISYESESNIKRYADKYS